MASLLALYKSIILALIAIIGLEAKCGYRNNMEEYTKVLLLELLIHES
jgi:hypothetical protein